VSNDVRGTSFDVRRSRFVVRRAASEANEERRTTNHQRPVVLKFGGELIEEGTHLATVVSSITAIAGATPLVIVHGGGKEIDAALKIAGIEKRQIDGLRITDRATLDVVVQVLAGAVNTRFVAALNTAGVAAVGLTGADAACGLSETAPPHHSVDGRVVDLGRVGIPAKDADPRLLRTLLADRFVPVIACIGMDRTGDLLNVNADTFAGHLAAAIGARRLVVAGTTPGVFDGNGSTIAQLDASTLARLVSDGTATAGMIAKLRACEHALGGGVDDVVIVDGRDGAALQTASTGSAPASATRLVRMVPA
jgi:acetylglutamate kinase